MQDLQSIVQRMVEAGESEENIATVIQHYKPSEKPSAPKVSTQDMLAQGPSSMRATMNPASEVLTEMALQVATPAMLRGGVKLARAAPSLIRGGLKMASRNPDTVATVASHVPGLKTPARMYRLAQWLRPKAAESTANTGGRLIKAPASKSVEDVMAETLQDLRVSKPSTVTLPPQRQLPPGYKPRTTVPAPKTPPAAAPAQPAGAVNRTGAAATGPIGPRPVGEALSGWEKEALERELTARGGTPNIGADDAARYLKEYGQLIPPGTRAARQTRYIEDALADQRYRFHLENPASALALTTGGGLAFRDALLSLLSGQEQ